jgi:ribonucleoside-triphosphate reductase
MHAPESRFYIRRVRVAVGSEVIEPLREAGFHLEPSVTDKENTLVVSIPVDAGKGVRTAAEMSMWEQLSLAAFLQRHWADNQVRVCVCVCVCV